MKQPASQSTTDEPAVSHVLLPSIGFYAQASVHMARAVSRAWCGRLTNARLVEGSHGLRRALERVGVRFEVSGLDTLTETAGPFVFAANHMSAMETQILPSILDRAAPCTFVVKSSLLHYPLFGTVLAAFDPIVVERTDPRADLRQVLEVGRARLAQGISVIVFPQAHRTATFDRKHFNSIGVRLARAAGVPVVPIALQTETWTRGRWVPDIGWIMPERPARFAIGTPLASNAPDTHQAVVRFIEDRLTRWEQAVALS